MTDTKKPGPIPPVPGASGENTETGKNHKNQGDTAGDAFADIFSSVNLDENSEGTTISGQPAGEVATSSVPGEKKEVALSEHLQQKFQEKASSVAHVMDPTIKGIDDIQAYIEQKKREKRQQTEYTTVQDGIYSVDGIDLRQIPGIYAIVPHAKGDHKLVFDAVHAPIDLRPDPAKREKGKPYVKNGNRIYDVELKMMEHPTLKSPDGSPLAVWVIGSPEELTKQINAIRRGKGGGTNLSDPLVVGVFGDVGEQQPQHPEEFRENSLEQVSVESASPEAEKEQQYMSSEITEPDAPEGRIQPEQEGQEESQTKQEGEEASQVEQEETPVLEQEEQEDVGEEALGETPVSDESFNEMPEAAGEPGKQDNLASYRGGGIKQDVAEQEVEKEYIGNTPVQLVEGEPFTKQFTEEASQDPLFHGDLQYDMELDTEEQPESIDDEKENNEKEGVNEVVNEQEFLEEEPTKAEPVFEAESEPALQAESQQEGVQPVISQEMQPEIEQEVQPEIDQEIQPETDIEQDQQLIAEEKSESIEETQDSSAIDLDTLSQPVGEQEGLSEESQKDAITKSAIVKPTTIEGILDATATEGKQMVISQPSHTKAIWVRLVVLLILLSGVGVIFTTMFSLENSPIGMVRDMLGLSQQQTGDTETIAVTSGATGSTGDDTLGRGDGLESGEDTIGSGGEALISGDDVGDDGANIGGDVVEEISGADAASLYTRDELVTKLEKQQEEARDILYEASIINNETATIYAKASSLKAQQTKEKALSTDHGALTQEDVFEIIKKIDHYLATARDAIDN